MKIRIDLKIIIFFAIFLFTNQIKIYLIIMFFCLLHELGHIFTGMLLKIKPEKIEIMPFGLSSSFKANLSDLNKKVKKGNLLEVKKIITALAGPIINLILAIFFIYADVPYITKQDVIYSNILILFFNLMPLYPLDGGRIIESILHIEFGEEKSKYLTNKISFVTIIVLTVMSSIAVYYFKNIAIFLVCIFLWIVTIHNLKHPIKRC